MHQEPRRQRAGTLAMAAAVLAWGSTSVIPRSVTSVDGIALTFHRLWVAALATSLVFLLRGGRFTWRLLWVCAPGGLAFGLDVILFFSAVKHTTVANATVIGALQPALLLLVVGRLFGERVQVHDVVWSGVAIAGVGVVVFGSSGAPVWSPLGDALAVGALFAWAAYFVASKQARRTLGAFEYQTGLTLVALVAVTPLALLDGHRVAVGSTHDWVLIAALAATSGGVGHLLANWAHAHLDLSRASLLTLGIPVTAAASAAVFLHEPVRPLQLAGMAIVLGALGVIVLRAAPTPVAPPGVEATPVVRPPRPALVRGSRSPSR